MEKKRFEDEVNNFLLKTLKLRMVFKVLKILFVVWIGSLILIYSIIWFSDNWISDPIRNPNQRFEFLIDNKIWFDIKRYGR